MQVLPGAVEQPAGDDLVGIALRHEDREVGEPAGLDRNTGVEGEGPGGATASSHALNHPIVASSEAATGRPMPRLANQA